MRLRRSTKTSPRSPANSTDGGGGGGGGGPEGATSPREHLGASSKGATLKLSRRLKLDLDEVNAIIKDSTVPKFKGVLVGGVGDVCSVAFAEEAIVAFFDITVGDMVQDKHVALYLPYFLLKHYHINLGDNAFVLTHESKLGSDSQRGNVFTLTGAPDDRQWCQKVIVALDKQIFAWLRIEAAQKTKGFFDFAGVSSEDNALEDANVLLMDRRAARRPNSVSAAASEIFGTRFIAKWVLRSDPKKITSLVERTTDVVLIPASMALVVLVPALAICFVMYWEEIRSFGGQKEKLVVAHCVNSKAPVNYVFTFGFAKQGELVDKVIRGLLETSVRGERVPLPQTYPPSQFVEGLRTQAGILSEQQRFKRLSSARSKRLSQTISDSPDLLRKEAGGSDKGKQDATRFTVNFLAGALDVGEEDAEDVFATAEYQTTTGTAYEV